MPFPIAPIPGEDEQQFLVQSPLGLRKQVLPIFRVRKADGFLKGLGTCFRSDPFGTFITAEHVLKEYCEDAGLRKAELAAALHGMGLGYGRARLRPEYFAPITHARSWRSMQEEPSPLFGDTSPPRMAADVMRFHVDDTEVPGQRSALPLPIRLRGRRPEVGDRVMALGFPELRCVKHEPSREVIALTERMYGAVGFVRELLPHGRGRTYPWPLIEVEANWRSGMSGGPVFNEASEVIGLVSFSIEPADGLPGVGYATDLSRVQLERLIPTIDRSNPGSYRCFGVVRGSPWHLAGAFVDLAQARRHLSTLGPEYEIRWGTYRIGSDNFTSSNQSAG